jgi:hypothetical protein
MTEATMSEPGCANCAWRAKYDQKPKSLLGRLWRFHANFCPGWKTFMKSLPEEEQRAFVEKYNFLADKFA